MSEFVTREKHQAVLDSSDAAIGALLRDKAELVSAGNELLRAVHALAISDKEGHARAWAQIDAAKQKWMNAR